MSWAGRRQLLYAGAAALIVLAAGGWFAYSAFSTAPICFDGKQNGGETGVDCGGPCSKLCPNQAHAPVVLWTRAFQTSPGVYAVAAYVENDNTGAGAKSVPYAFRLFDEQNLLIVEKDGTADIPPQQTVPIFVSGINAGTRAVAHVFLEFSAAPVWNKIDARSLPNVHSKNLQLEAGGARLSAMVENDGSSDVRNLALIAVLFDRSGTALNASRSVLQKISRGTSEPVVFTWPQGNTAAVRAEITAVPSL